MLALGMVERVAYCLRMKEQFMEERTEYILIYDLLVEVQVKTQFYETDNTIAYSWPGVRDEKFKVRVWNLKERFITIHKQHILKRLAKLFEFVMFNPSWFFQLEQYFFYFPFIIASLDFFYREHFCYFEESVN